MLNPSNHEISTSQAQENLSSVLRNLIIGTSQTSPNCQKYVLLGVEFVFDQLLEKDFFAWNQDLIGSKPNKKLQIYLASKPDFELFDQSLSKKPKFDDSINSLEDLLKNYRPNLDLAYCYLSFHDFDLHRNLWKSFCQNLLNNSDDNSLLKKIFDEFEKMRVVKVGSDEFQGVAKNILLRICDDFFWQEKEELLHFLPILLIEHFSSLNFYLKNLEELGKKITKFSEFFSQDIKSDLLKISTVTNSQKDYGLLVLKLIQKLESQQKERDLSAKSTKSGSENSSQNSKNSNLDQNFGAETINKEPASQSQESSGKQENREEKPEDLQENHGIFTDQPQISHKSQIISANFQENFGKKISFRNNYRVFCNKFDEVISPSKFLKKDELQHLREQLDSRMQNLKKISRKNSINFRKKLLTKKELQTQLSNTSGILNRKILTQIITNPNNSSIWQQHKIQNLQDIVLTILLDNSGSMRGNPIVISAMACEMIAKILEEFAIKTEIIGFTTGDWRGGRVRKMWESLGRPKNPGRLNELRHIIYKSFSQNFKKSRVNLGMMIKEGILKENIDGEALLFARARLAQQAAKRKILLVISDGNPVDDSTNSNNSGDLLSDHLSFVINQIEKQKGAGKVEIVGIGIGHSTSDFYQNEISIKNIEDLGDAMIEKIIQVLPG